MQISINFSALKQTKWYEVALRILFGGLITVATGIIAKRFGPAVGGLFLAFPAIFPASATLIEKHAKEKKRLAGFDGTNRGRDEASLDARGAAMGALGLIAFALIVWKFLPGHTSWLILSAATLAWLGISVILWRLRKVFKI